MAIHAIQCPLATHELGDGLVIIVQAVNRLVSTRVELHLAQVIVSTIVAGVALPVWDGGGQAVDGLVHMRIRSRCMAGGAARQAGILRARQWLRREMAVQTVISKGLDTRRCLL